MHVIEKFGIHGRLVFQYLKKQWSLNDKIINIIFKKDCAQLPPKL